MSFSKDSQIVNIVGVPKTWLYDFEAFMDRFVEKFRYAKTSLPYASNRPGYKV